MTEWRRRAIERGYVPGRNHLMDMVWDLPDWPGVDAGESTEDYLARLRHHGRECERWSEKYATKVQP